MYNFLGKKRANVFLRCYNCIRFIIKLDANYVKGY